MKAEIQRFIQLAIDQIFNRTPTRNEKVVLTQWALKKANEYHINVKDLKDVFKHGEEVKEGMIIRKYNACEIGLTYKYDARNGSYVIITCWKR